MGPFMTRMYSGEVYVMLAHPSYQTPNKSRHKRQARLMPAVPRFAELSIKFRSREPQTTMKQLLALLAYNIHVVPDSSAPANFDTICTATAHTFPYAPQIYTSYIMISARIRQDICAGTLFVHT
jgi:hypothetical protein